MPLFFPERLKTALNMQVVPLAMPVTEVPVAPPPPQPKAKGCTDTETAGDRGSQSSTPNNRIFSCSKRYCNPRSNTWTAKAPELAPQTPVLEAKFIDNTNQPKRPEEEVKVNNLNTGSAAAPTVKSAGETKVQTGGFGDPNGIAGQG